MDKRKYNLSLEIGLYGVGISAYVRDRDCPGLGPSGSGFQKLSGSRGRDFIVYKYI
jgi:hypothetical protein